MADKKKFKCTHCDGRMEVDKEAAPPECCGEPMAVEPLDQCTLSSTAEHTRFNDTQEPCDDGRSG